MGLSERRAADDAAVGLSAGAAGYALGAPVEDIVGEGRGSADVAFARQVAMYLCHVVFEWSLARVAQAFGRDRSTVAHTCHTIEDRRDDDAFDDWIGALEQSVRTAAPARSGVARP
jgi:chromosomal replication initiation ATPase DnaA